MSTLTRLRGSRWTPHLLALVLYTIVALVLFGWPLADLSHRCLCDNSSDAEAYMWELAWWPHAIGAGINPFVTHSIFAPDSINLAMVASIPGASLLSWPVFALAGPLPTYDLLALASPILSGWAAFALCRYVSGSVAAGLVGGAMYGFSSYETGQLIGHLNLTLVFLIPVAVLLVLRCYDGRISERRFTLLMAALIVLQLLLSTEIAATMAFAGVVALASAYWFAAPDRRARLRVVLRRLLLAGGVAAVVASPLLYYALFRGVPMQQRHLGDVVSADGLSWFIPTLIMRFGRAHFAAVSGTFVTDLSENGSYIPFPLLALAGAALISIRRTVAGRLLALTVAVVVLIALGSHLHIAGKATIPLPWSLVDETPFFNQIAPARLAIYVWLAAAVLVSMTLARVRARRWVVWAAALIGLAMLTPNLSTNLWRFRPSLPRFFTSDTYRRVLVRDEVVLPLPSPLWPASGANLWQAQTHMYFRMAAGYVGAIGPLDYSLDPANAAITTGHTDPTTAAKLRPFLVRHQVRHVLLDASQPGTWPTVLAQLGLRGRLIEGVLVYPVPAQLPAAG